MLYIFIFLHQTTTAPWYRVDELKLYIFIFLHQTTTQGILGHASGGCISLYSYTKPQPGLSADYFSDVVYLYIPTPNHNRCSRCRYAKLLYIFIFLHQTTTPNESFKIGYSCISLYSYTKPQPKETNILIIR